MTADEMLRKLGYSREEDDDETLVYARRRGRIEEIIRVFKKMRDVQFTLNGHYVEMSYDEILAVAKLIEEMEGGQ